MNPVYQIRAGTLCNVTNRARKLERDHMPFGMLATFILTALALGIYAGWSMHP
jgi:hypothetical protein